MLHIGRRKPPGSTCRDDVLAAIGQLTERTGEDAFTVAAVFTEMVNQGTRYKESAVQKAMQRMQRGGPVAGPAMLERTDRQSFRLGIAG